MRFNILTLMLFMGAIIVSATPLPTTIDGLAIKRHFAGALVDLQRRTDPDLPVIRVLVRMQGTFLIHEPSLILNDQVYVAHCDENTLRYHAIKYSKTFKMPRINTSGPYGPSFVGVTSTRDAKWIIRHAPSENLNFFTHTQQYRKLVEAHANLVNSDALHEEVLKLLDHAGELAAKRVHHLGQSCWARMQGYKLDDFVFNFGHEEADVLRVPMGHYKGTMPAQVHHLVFQFQRSFKEEWNRATQYS